MTPTLVITGASRGIGLATAQFFLDKGYDIINISRASSPAKQVYSIQIDLSDSAQYPDLKKKLLQKIDKKNRIVLVHNAARVSTDTIFSCNPKEFERDWAVQLLAPRLLNEWLIPFMSEGSSIIYVGSTLSEKGVSHHHSYVIYKHAVVGMMRASCQDLIHEKIHTCCVCPGFTDTDMLREAVGYDDEMLSQISQRVGANRLISPFEIAKTIAFCAENPVINGSVIHAHLGQIES